MRSLAPGSLFAGYRIEAVLGEGGMGSVYRARHVRLERAVALKVIAGSLADDTHFCERFRREVRAAASLDHPHVVPVFEADECDGRLYLAMRLVEGVDLAKLISDEGRIEPRRAARMVAQIASALHAAHERGLVHRDVKPGNVLVSEVDGRDHVYLTDFGIARRQDDKSALTRSGALIGTLDYMPSEAFRGEPVGAAGDVYALGCVLYQMLAGEVPFPHDSVAAKIAAHLSQPPPSIADRVPGLPQALDRVVVRALAKDPGERFASARQLGLDALAAPETVGTSDATLPDGPPARPRPNNLPTEPSPLVGREAEIAAISRHVREARIVTLTGPGGTGKTRLALAVAAALLEEFEDGVFFVDLSKIKRARLVLSSVAQALDVSDVGGEAIYETLARRLRSQRLLLVLDNFEHVLKAVPAVADLRARADQLHVLATSRAPLHLAGEQEFPVPPLSLPDVESGAVTDSEAVTLFIARAQAIRPGFDPTEHDLHSIVDICRRLDGLPLAIELAAARVRVLAPEALLRRLDHRLALLRGGARDVDPRHRTLSGAIDWSYELLDTEQQRLFARLSVCVGGCTLDTAQALSAIDVDVLDGVTALVENNLLRQRDGPDGDPRFTMLETIREYALDRLAGLPDHEAVHESHATHFLALAESAADAGVRAPGFDRLESDHANIRAALAWFRGRGEADRELRLATAMSRFWSDRGYLHEGLERLESALARSSGPTARSLTGLSRLRLQTGGSTDDLLLDATRAIGVCEKDGDDRAVGEAWNLRGQALIWLGRPSEAEAALEQAIAYAEGVGAADEAAEARVWLLILALYGPMPVERGLELCRTTRERAGENRMLLAFTLVEGAALEAMRGNFDEARRMLAEGKAMLDDLELRIYAANTGQEAFFVEMLGGDPVAAAGALRQGYDALAAMGETAFLSTVAGYLAHALHGAGRLADVEHWADVSKRNAAPDDLTSQTLWRMARAKALAQRGDNAEAECLAREGVEIARQDASPSSLADALMDLAEVLRLSGRPDDITPAIEEAIRLYDAKGNVVSAAAARRRLGALQPWSVDST